MLSCFIAPKRQVATERLGVSTRELSATARELQTCARQLTEVQVRASSAETDLTAERTTRQLLEQKLAEAELAVETLQVARQQQDSEGDRVSNSEAAVLLRARVDELKAELEVCLCVCVCVLYMYTVCREGCLHGLASVELLVSHESTCPHPWRNPGLFTSEGCKHLSASFSVRLG